MHHVGHLHYRHHKFVTYEQLEDNAFMNNNNFETLQGALLLREVLFLFSHLFGKFHILLLSLLTLLCVRVRVCVCVCVDEVEVQAAHAMKLLTCEPCTEDQNVNEM